MTKKLTVETLRALRKERQAAVAARGAAAQITVGMGTCGIAAGSKDTYDAIVEALEAKGLADVLVRLSGCMGLCYAEPTVEVRVPEMPVVIYGGVDRDAAKQIVAEHIVDKRLLNDHICDKPAIDIIA